jgi:predicted AAA+ superfamily ATPase
MGMTNTELKRIITESTEIRLTKIIRRNYDDDIEKLTDSSRPLKILTGIRRGGKSTILKKLYFNDHQYKI